MDEKEKTFLVDLTLALYSSFEIEKTLESAFLVLKKYIPVDLIHIFTFDKKLNMLSYLAEATQNKSLLIDKQIKFKKNNVFLENKKDYSGIVVLKSNEAKFLNYIRDYYFYDTELSGLGQNQDFSVMIIDFDILSPVVGGFGIVAKGNNVFKDRHIKLMSCVKNQLIGAVLNLLHHRDLVRRNKILEDSVAMISSKKIVGKSFKLKKVLELANKVAVLDCPVLILGETGTGKELIADRIRDLSQRKNEKIVKVNCGAIPESLMDTELFGHEKGAFTGAAARKKGYFEQADKGIIFLDEIGELSMVAQVKLLRILQTMEFSRVGGDSPVYVNVRIIAATNKDLEKMVEKGSFRQDLWFRLNVFPINLPPLRKRIEDIEMLCNYFIEKKCREMNLQKRPVISDHSISCFKNYFWPGNIRELQNVIERALILNKCNILDFEDIVPFGGRRILVNNKEENFSICGLDEMIKEHIKNALKLSNYKIEGKNGAAVLLKLNPSTLRSKMKKYNITIKRHINVR